MKLRIVPVCCMIAIALGSVACAEVANDCDVLEWIKEHPKAGQKQTAPAALKPQWIGTVKVVLRHDPDKIFSKEKDDPMRLNDIRRDAEGRVVVGRVAADSTSSAQAVFIQKLPGLGELDKAKKLSELRKWFGPQHGWTDGWGTPDTMHWSESWTYFTVTENKRLRWLSVFAMVSGKPKAGNDANIDCLLVREGFLRPADPKSGKEKAAYPSAENLADAEERQRQAERAKLPLPLRDLMAAKQKLGDHDLRAYVDYINRFRSDPRPDLLNQLAARINEGTCEIKGVAENILSDNRRMEGIRPWTKDKKRIALRQAVAAIGHVPDHSGLKDWSVRILSAIGGGGIEAVGVKVKGNTTTYGGGTMDSQDIKSAKAATRREFESKFPYLREP